MGSAANRSGDEAEDAGRVYAAYGSIMHLVQTWELALALVCERHRLTTGVEREAESAEARRVADSLEKAFTRRTAGRIRDDLRGLLPDRVLDEVSGLIPDRNRLAHRFLRERQLPSGFQPGSVRWLAGAGERFEASTDRLADIMMSFPEYDGPVREHWPALAAELVDRLFAGEPLDYDGALRRTAQD